MNLLKPKSFYLSAISESKYEGFTSTAFFEVDISKTEPFSWTVELLETDDIYGLCEAEIMKGLT